MNRRVLERHGVVFARGARRLAVGLLAVVCLFACTDISLEQGKQAYAAGDWSTARRGLEANLYAADPEAFVLWGDLLRDGKGGPADPAEAARAYAVAASAGNAAAQARLRSLADGGAPAAPRFVGLGEYMNVAAPLLQVLAWRSFAEQDLRAGRPERALVVLRALAAIPSLGREGALRVAEIYDRGEGVPEDDQEAMRWYQRAADAGSETAPARLRQLRRAAQQSAARH